jgi:hypothetical protein
VNLTASRCEGVQDRVRRKDPQRDIEQCLADAGIQALSAELMHDHTHLLVARACQLQVLGDAADAAMCFCDRTLRIVQTGDRGDKAWVDPGRSGGQTRQCAADRAPTPSRVRASFPSQQTVARVEVRPD